MNGSPVTRAKTTAQGKLPKGASESMTKGANLVYSPGPGSPASLLSPTFLAQHGQEE
jgi:hypothetical protein